MSVATKVTIQNITTNLYAEELGTATITWDMAVTNAPNPNHGKKDWWEPETNEKRDVESIRLVELQLFDKVGVNITEAIFENPYALEKLKRKLISSTLDREVAELQEGVVL